MKFITINPIDMSVRTYESYAKVLSDTIKLHDQDPEHPAFLLYEIKGDGRLAHYKGRFHRKFGHGYYCFEEDL